MQGTELERGEAGFAQLDELQSWIMENRRFSLSLQICQWLANFQPADAQVVLTVQQQSLADPAVAPTAALRSSTMPASPPGPPGGGGRHHGHHHHVSAPAGRYLEKKRQMESQRKHTYRLMLEEEQRHIESLRYDLAKNNDIRTSHELAKAERRVRTLQEQLIGLEAATTSPD
ncbi:hypothetical protein B566_EDAN017677, partial [Ephemera danica]